jgi:hypothetical protein
MPDLLVVPGSLRTLSGGNLSKAQPNIRFAVQNNGTSAGRDISISISWRVLDSDGEYLGYDSSTYTIADLGAGELESINDTLAQGLGKGALAVVKVEIEFSNPGNKYTFESSYSNNEANANFTIEPEPETSQGRREPPAEPLPWGLISGVVIVLIGLAYLVIRSVGRAISRREELAGKALPSDQLKEALGARMSAASAAATQAVEAAPSGEKPGPEAPAAPKRPRCPSCMSPLDRRGRRMLVCPECGYMSFDET